MNHFFIALHQLEWWLSLHKEISWRPWKNGDLLYCILDSFAVIFAPLSMKYFVGWEISLGKLPTVFFHNPYDMFGLQTYQTNCLLQTNTPALHFRVGSRHHGKHGSHVSQQRKLTSCLLQSFFQDFSFYSQICMFVSKPSCLLSYLSNMKLCNNFYEHFRTLHDWLKNIVRLFSAYPNNETRKKLFCHA